MPLEGEERALWEEYAFSNDADLRASIIEHYLPFADILARQHDFKDSDLPINELRQLAYLGLVEAVDRFDFEREASFRTFAAFRIKGAILNGVEKASEKRAQMALRNRILKQRTGSLSESGNTFEKLAEVAVGLAIGFMLEDSPGLYMGTAECVNSGEDEEVYLLLQRELVTVLAELPEKERTVITRHYFDGVDFVEIAADLGVTRGRVSQLHKAALGRLLRALRRPSIDGSY